ncbi:glycosyltransferase family 32 protein [Rhodotorula graminis WP1]|uniref:Glycosyltransferase family 32 protein n=1 Tax=Rhodotorula graminis (strain WP1) TaxID=578459 RepID=A0A0P9FBW8_RHOGW|nr:glycosyltransferase family 32 protein [Rhodotorula graminis WP1]KPV73136.1 glycosyltransferase family 32 protein [Rhodotorula graminis WP1]
MLARKDSVDEPLLPTRTSSPPPSQQRRPRPLSSTTRAALGLAAACLALYLLAAPSTRTSTAAVVNPAPALELHHTAAVDPAERLALLNADYDPHREGYGVGSTDLQAYGAGLRRTLAQVLERGGGGGEGRGQGAMADEDDDGLAPSLVDDDALADALEYRLSLEARECPSGARAIPPDLYATARTVSPVPPALQSWLGAASPLSLHLLSSEAIVAFVARRFPALSSAYAALPIPILRYDLFRLVALAARGGVYTDADTRLLRPFPFAEWPADVDDRTDPALRRASSSSSASSTSTSALPSHADIPPALVIGLEWASSSPYRAQKNVLNPLYNREAGVVQWTFGAAAGHPVLLDAVRRVLRHMERVAALEGAREGGQNVRDEMRWKENGVDEGALQFDPRADRMVLEWSGPAVLTDSVARYLRTRHGASLPSLAHALSRTPRPIRVGDVLLLPIQALNARTDAQVGWKVLDWALGRGWAPWKGAGGDEGWGWGGGIVVHEHAASWWKQRIGKDKD